MKTESQLKILNLGCGLHKIDGAINIDVDPVMEPDQVWDLKNFPYPFENDSVDVVYMLHIIEHLQEKSHVPLLNEISRILRIPGMLVISYPEFTSCAMNYIDNKYGQRTFWKDTLYGRQTSETDYHISLMDTRYFSQTLRGAGLEIKEQKQETGQDYNTILFCEKVPVRNTREDILRQEVCGE